MRFSASCILELLPSVHRKWRQSATFEARRLGTCLWLEMYEKDGGSVQQWRIYLAVEPSKQKMNTKYREALLIFDDCALLCCILNLYVSERISDLH